MGEIFQLTREVEQQVVHKANFDLSNVELEDDSGNKLN